MSQVLPVDAEAVGEEQPNGGVLDGQVETVDVDHTEELPACTIRLRIRGAKSYMFDVIPKPLRTITEEA